MNAEDRIVEITRTLDSIQSAWPVLAVELQKKIDRLVLDLISQDNEQTRGRIKALRDLKGLPETLHSEREGIKAGLADAPANE